MTFGDTDTSNSSIKCKCRDINRFIYFVQACTGCDLVLVWFFFFICETGTTKEWGKWCHKQELQLAGCVKWSKTEPGKSTQSQIVGHFSVPTCSDRMESSKVFSMVSNRVPVHLIFCGQPLSKPHTV